MSLPTLPADKGTHYVYGTGIALVVQTAAAQIGINLGPLRPKDIGLIAAVVFGIGKEAADKVANVLAVRAGKAKPRAVEFGDIVATAAGGLAIWSAQP